MVDSTDTDVVYFASMYGGGDLIRVDACTLEKFEAFARRKYGTPEDHKDWFSKLFVDERPMQMLELLKAGKPVEAWESKQGWIAAARSRIEAVRQLIGVMERLKL